MAIVMLVVSVELVSAETTFSNTDSDKSIVIPPNDIPQWKNKYKNFAKSRECLIKNVFYEAPRYFPGMENNKKYRYIAKSELQAAIKKERQKIINVTFNRVKSNRYADDICSVVYQYKQFSWTLNRKYKTKKITEVFKHDRLEMQNYYHIRKLVTNIMINDRKDITNGALYYHTVDIHPYWKNSKKFIVATLWHNYYQ